MFDVGFTEIMLIGVVALVVIGPERLPDVARTVGGYIGKLQRFVTGVKRDIRAELETGELKKLIGDQKDQLDELRKAVDTTRREMDTGARSLVGDAKKTLAGLEDAADNTPQAESATLPAEPVAKDQDSGSWKSQPAGTASEATSALPDMTGKPDADAASTQVSSSRVTGTDT